MIIKGGGNTKTIRTKLWACKFRFEKEKKVGKTEIVPTLEGSERFR